MKRDMRHLTAIVACLIALWALIGLLHTRETHCELGAHHGP